MSHSCSSITFGCEHFLSSRSGGNFFNIMFIFAFHLRIQILSKRLQKKSLRLQISRFDENCVSLQLEFSAPALVVNQL